MRTALLDLDGTLLDSAALITEHLAAALASIGAPVPEPAALLAMVGPPWETALPAMGLGPEQTAAAIAAYRAGYDPIAPTHTPIFPGIPALLKRLSAAGIRLATATSKPEWLARRMVDGAGFTAHFELVGGADDRIGRIGKAAVVGSVIERLGLDPARDAVVMVGDRHHDVEGAAAHGIPTIGVAWGYAEPGELRDAHKIAADPDDLAAILTTDAVWAQ